MTPAELSRTVRHAVCRAVQDGALRVEAPESIDSVKIERPRPGGRGDYATGIALRLARQAGRPAADVAAELGRRIAAAPGIEAVDVTGPGFLNITLAPDNQQQLVREVLERGGKYGWTELTGQVAQPTYRADVRAAVTADTLRRILLSQGTLCRTFCEGTADPVWADLGVRIEAEEARGRLRTDVMPVPAEEDGAALLRRLGADAARWGLLAAAAHDRPRTEGRDGRLLLVQHERNPLFRVRYAHSRAHALTRHAAQLGFTAAPDRQVDAPALTAAIGDHPAVLADAARLRAPDRLVRHLEVTADALLSFQHSVLPVGDEKPSAAHRARLALAEAAGTVLAGGLSLLGISAPEHL
ncbi:ArgS-related anticodon-binding protein NrtL [Streptomyces xantholiticus]|uniref:arginine--tRNA ligase n=1 Tax=Streptomyces xantholiticus TaxID=68285 RepID=A0ABV1UPH8_9ACTN